jgi:hypothetical protein
MNRHRLQIRRALGVALLSVFAAGCSTEYSVRKGPWISPVLVHGRSAFVREDRMYREGCLGGGLLAAVSGNPEAERAARGQTRALWASMGLVTGALVCLAAGSVARPDRPLGSVARQGAVVAGGVMAFAGLFEGFNANGYRWDAVNLYNDDVEESRSPSR